MLAPGGAVQAPPPAELAGFEKLNLWFYTDVGRTEPSLPRATSRTTEGHVRRGGGDAVGAEALRGKALPVVRQLLRVRRLLRGLPRGRHHQAGTGAALRVRLRPLHGVRHLLRAVPLCTPSRWSPRRRRPDHHRRRQRSLRIDVAYRLNEVCAIYPITPSSAMAELADQWSGEGAPNLWGDGSGGGRDAERGRARRGRCTARSRAAP
jgi:hypothetical protein